MLLNEIVDPIDPNRKMFNTEAGKRDGKLKDLESKIWRYLKKYPNQAPHVSKILGVDLKIKSRKSAEHAGLKLESFLLSGAPEYLMVKGRDDINEVIMEFYQNDIQLNEAIFKTGIRGAKAVGRNVSKLNNLVNKAGKRLQNTDPVQNFDKKAAKLISDYKNKLGDDHKAVKAAQELGRLGAKHPKKSAFVIGVLSGLTAMATGPTAGLAVGGALRTAIGMAKGEKASSSVGNVAKVAGLGVLGGQAVGALADGITSAGKGAVDLVRDAVVQDLSNDIIYYKSENMINGKSFNFYGLVDSEALAKIQELEKIARSHELGTPAFAKAAAEKFSYMDAVMNGAESQKEFVTQMDNADIEKYQRGVMKSTVSKIGGIMELLGVAGGAGTASATAETGLNKNKKQDGKTSARAPTSKPTTKPTATQVRPEVKKIQGIIGKLTPEEKKRVANGVAALLR